MASTVSLPATSLLLVWHSLLSVDWKLLQESAPHICKMKKRRSPSPFSLPPPLSLSLPPSAFYSPGDRHATGHQFICHTIFGSICCQGIECSTSDHWARHDIGDMDISLQHLENDKISKQTKINFPSIIEKAQNSTA